MGTNLLGLRGSMQKDREREREDESRLRKMRDESAALGYDELGRYKSGELSKPQKEMVDELHDTQQARTDEYYKKAGLEGTTAQAGQEWQNHVNEVLLKETMRENSWVKAMTSFGFSRQEAEKLIALNKERRQESMQIFQGLMGALGSIVGTYMKKGK